MSVFGKFPRTFWVANVIELFERWAWYGFFMLFANYLTGSSDAGGLEFTQEQKGWLMGVGTGILYFLPVLTGAIADRYGYRKVLFLAFLIYVSAFLFSLCICIWRWELRCSSRSYRRRLLKRPQMRQPPSVSAFFI